MVFLSRLAKGIINKYDEIVSPWLLFLLDHDQILDSSYPPTHYPTDFEAAHSSKYEIDKIFCDRWKATAIDTNGCYLPRYVEIKEKSTFSERLVGWRNIGKKTRGL